MKSIVIALPQPSVNVDVESEPPRPIGERISSFLRRYGAALFFLILLISGMIVGAVRTSSAQAMPGKMDEFFASLPVTFEKKTPIAVFSDSFSASFIFAAALCFLALTPAGLPAIPALVFFRGYEYGVVSGCLCVQYGFRGLAYFLSVMLAGSFLASLSLVYLSQFCLQCSGAMLLAAAGHAGGRALRDKFRDLIMNAAYAIILIVFASLTDTVLYLLIGRLF